MTGVLVESMETRRDPTGHNAVDNVAAHGAGGGRSVQHVER